MTPADKELIDRVFLAFGSTLARVVDEQPVPAGHIVAALVRFLAGFIASRPPEMRQPIIDMIHNTLPEQIDFYVNHGISIGQHERPN